jgi:aerobic-type carbon monoxide dehydrogenase small subunit (CoxS/CutS family)
MAERKEIEGTGRLSRREFLRDAGLLVGGTAIGSSAFLAACNGGKTVTSTVTSTVAKTGGSTVTVTSTTPPVTITAQTGAGEVAEAIIKLNINGDDMGVMVRPNWTLQQVLHSELGLTGTKEWCDAGACGACTVIIDGRPVISCMLLAIECTGKKIETVEGIARDNHPLIAAYKNNNCMQCGYCTPGFVCTAKALLDKNPNPTTDQIMNALSGNLCRCATYPQHPLAVQEAAKKLGGK